MGSCGGHGTHWQEGNVRGVGSHRVVHSGGEGRAGSGKLLGVCATGGRQRIGDLRVGKVPNGFRAPKSLQSNSEPPNGMLQRGVIQVMPNLAQFISP